VLVKTILASESIDIPEDVGVTVNGSKVTVEGNLGIIEQDFSHTRVTIKKEDNVLSVESPWANKRKAAMVGTVRSHIRNMMKGVTKGFTYKLKIIFAHFPMSVKTQNDRVIIENFSGERKPRIAKIMEDVKVSVDGEDVIVKGINLNNVSQTAANIQQATRIKKKDPRVFLDGIYIYQKTEEI
jgi:large subunit ribosomal protein L6